VDEGANAMKAAEDFDRGFRLLMGNNTKGALPLLARAAHLAPKNARYHAFYGKALSHDDKHRHKAEGEMQTAIKLEPQNPGYRLILAEFFVRIKLLKRAEGELNRLLAAFPDNTEARSLLDSLQSK
jgi:predicted Zn-dependent protease